MGALGVRLHALSVTAFGPFGGTVDVDFDDLGADGLFLLHGPTGAGKTSVLDAIAFALYGVLPGSRRESRRLLSDHAAPGVVPRVELDATLGGRRLTIVRQPEFLRPKRRGVGTTKQNAKATLTWHDGRGENLTRIDEIALEVERLLGMRVDQFFQVVLLPQGDFARFLRARNEERGALLEQLFDTDRFRDIETWFQDQRRASAERLAGRSESVDRLAAQVATAAGVDLFTGTDVVEWGTDLLGGARELARGRTEHLRTARAEHAASRETARIAHRRREARERGAAAAARLTVLADGDAERAQQIAELDRARRALPVRDRAVTLDQHRQRAAAAAATMRRRERAAAETEAAVLVGTLSWPPRPADAEVLDAAVHRWSGECAVLDSVAGDESDRRTAVADRERAVGRVRGLETDLRAVRVRLDAVPEERAALDAEHRVAVAARAGLAGLEARHHGAEDAARAHVEWARESERLAAAVTTAERARTRYDDRRTEWLDLRERRLEGMSAELAAGLEDGAPCGVCGATEHPAPASPTAGRVSRDDENRAGQRVGAAEAERTTADAAVQRCRQRVDELATRCADRTAAELAAELDAATTALAEARRAADRLAAIDSALAALDEETAGLRVRTDAITAELGVTRGRTEALETRIAEATARITAAVGTTSTVAERRAALDAAIAAAVAWRDARRDADSADQAVMRLETDLVECAREHGFTEVTEALAAVRDRARCTVLENAVLDAEKQRSAAAAVLAEPDVAEAMVGETVDTAAVDAEEIRLRGLLDEAIASAGDADSRLRMLEDLVAQLWAAADRLGPAHLEHAELEQLAEVVAGKGANARRMSLRSYVLAARLEDVATAASVRFRLMSQGRFEFVHSDDVGPRGTRGGLGLDVRDDYTGVVRSAGTLSGGEAFCASLALALGLADVVAAEAGGITLDTMFIDEGFGSLDSGSLDAVMGVLDELRSGGRTVGIVSHVDEIRDRVPSRLEVIRERHGSTVRVHAGV